MRYETEADFSGHSHGQPSVVPDVQHVSDMIKKKRTFPQHRPLHKEGVETDTGTEAPVVRDNKTPDAALRFSTLYTRLLSQRVLSQKWAILYLLHELSNSLSTGASSSATEIREAFAPDNTRSEPGRVGGAGDNAFSEAFSYMGLHRLPRGDSSRGPGSGPGGFGSPWGSFGPSGDEGGMKTKAELLAEREDNTGDCT